jgi:hypothetical protein
MEIENLKRWHWIAAGIVVGLALAYVWSSVEPERGRRGSADDLFRNAALKDPKTGRAIVSSVVVHPPEEGPHGMVNVVTYKKWMNDAKSKKTVSANYWFVAEIPFVPPGQRPDGVAPNFTISDQLKDVQKRAPQLAVSSAWWTTRPATFAIWTLGSVVVIGGLWPTLLNVIVGAGYGHPRRAEKKMDADEAYLARFKGDGKREPAKPTKPLVTAAEHERLREMTEQLESKLGGLGNVPASQAGAGATSESPVRKLDGGPLELTPIANQADDDEIEVKGEYYPVLIHHKKHHDESKDDAPPKPQD